MDRPLCVDLYAGLGGWSEGFLAEGYRCVGYDIERHDYGTGGYPGELILRDVREIHGSEFKDAACIVASPPCQKYSYMAMPWSRAKAMAAAIRADESGRMLADLNELFEACFRIQREASEAVGRHIPMIVENVRGAQLWVGHAQYHYGSFFLWGDVPALMPITAVRHSKVPGFRFDGSGKTFQTTSVEHTKNNRGDDEGMKRGGDWFGSGEDCSQRRFSGTKQPGISGPRTNGKGDKWFQDGAAAHGSRSNSRKAASAMIAKIPLRLSTHIARCFYPVPPIAEDYLIPPLVGRASFESIVSDEDMEATRLG